MNSQGKEAEMRRKSLRYNFIPVQSCIMCGKGASFQETLGKRMNSSQGLNPKIKSGISTSVVRCRHCGLIYSNPQPVPENIQDHYGVLPETYWNSEYFSIDQSYFQYELILLKNFIKIKEGMKALDIGAGLGKTMMALSRSGFDVYGIEPGRQFYERAISRTGISPDRLKNTMLEETEFPENHFHFISFGAVLEHLYNPSEAILKALTWLKPGGIIQIEVPSSGWLISKLINLYYWFRRTDYVTNLSPMHEPYHLYEFSLKSFRSHATLHNYELVHHEYYVCNTHLPGFADFILKPVMKITGTGMQLSVWLRKK